MGKLRKTEMKTPSRRGNRDYGRRKCQWRSKR